MRLSGLAGFFLYDALRRAQVTDGRVFCVRPHDGENSAETTIAGDNSSIVFRTGYSDVDGYHLEMERPSDRDKVAEFRGRPILAIDRETDRKLAATRLDARMEGDTVTLFLSADIASFMLSDSE